MSEVMSADMSPGVRRLLGIAEPPRAPRAAAPPKNTRSAAKAKLTAHAATLGYPSAIEYVVAQIAAGKNIAGIWREIGATKYSSRRMFDNIVRTATPDARSRISAARPAKFPGNYKRKLGPAKLARMQSNN